MDFFMISKLYEQGCQSLLNFIVITEIGLSLWNYWNASIFTEIQDFILKDEKLGVGVEFKIDLYKLLLYHIHMR